MESGVAGCVRLFPGYSKEERDREREFGRPQCARTSAESEVRPEVNVASALLPGREGWCRRRVRVGVG